MTAANEAPAPVRLGRKVELMLYAVRRAVGPDRFERAALICSDEFMDQLRHESGTTLFSLERATLLHAAGEFMGLPIEIVDVDGVFVTSPGEKGWPGFVAAQGKRLAGLTLARLPTTSARARSALAYDVADQPALELAMVKIAERIAW